MAPRYPIVRAVPYPFGGLKPVRRGHEALAEVDGPSSALPLRGIETSAYLAVHTIGITVRAVPYPFGGLKQGIAYTSSIGDPRPSSALPLRGIET